MHYSYFYYFLLVINCILYIWSHTHTLVRVNYDAKVSLNNSFIPLSSSFIDFDIIHSITLTWNSGAYLISTIITVFSLVLPYIKLIILYVYSERGNHLLTIINKFAFIDIMFIGYMLCIFNWDSSKPVISTIYIDIIPVCYNSLVTFTLAILMTNVISLYICEEAKPKTNNILQKLLLGISLLLLIFGMQMPFFSVTINALDVKEITTQYTSFSLITFLITSTNWGMIFIGYIFLVGLIIYIFYLIASLYGNENVHSHNIRLFSFETFSVMIFAGYVTLIETDNITKEIATSVCNSECFASTTTVGDSVWLLLFSYISLIMSSIDLQEVKDFLNVVINNIRHSLNFSK